MKGMIENSQNSVKEKGKGGFNIMLQLNDCNELYCMELGHLNNSSIWSAAKKQGNRRYEDILTGSTACECAHYL